MCRLPGVLNERKTADCSPMHAALSGGKRKNRRLTPALFVACFASCLPCDRYRLVSVPATACRHPFPILPSPVLVSLPASPPSSAHSRRNAEQNTFSSHAAAMLQPERQCRLRHGRRCPAPPQLRALHHCQQGPQRGRGACNGDIHPPAAGGWHVAPFRTSGLRRSVRCGQPARECRRTEPKAAPHTT